MLIGHYLAYNNHTKILHVTRARIIDDAYHFIFEERIDVQTYFYIVTYLRKETNYVVWHAMMNILTYMSPFLKFYESKDFTVRSNKVLLSFNLLLLRINDTFRTSWCLPRVMF